MDALEGVNWVVLKTLGPKVEDEFHFRWFENSVKDRENGITSFDVLR